MQSIPQTEALRDHVIDRDIAAMNDGDSRDKLRGEIASKVLDYEVLGAFEELPGHRQRAFMEALRRDDKAADRLLVSVVREMFEQVIQKELDSFDAACADDAAAELAEAA